MPLRKNVKNIRVWKQRCQSSQQKEVQIYFEDGRSCWRYSYISDFSIQILYQVILRFFLYDKSSPIQVIYGFGTLGRANSNILELCNWDSLDLKYSLTCTRWVGMKSDAQWTFLRFSGWLTEFTRVNLKNKIMISTEFQI